MQRQGHKEMAGAGALRSSAVSKGRGCKWGGSGNLEASVGRVDTGRKIKADSHTLDVLSG